MNRYEMYEAYYKEQYCNVVACIESVYPELFEDEVICDCITEIRLFTFLIEKRMKEIAELNKGEITSVRLPGKIHNVDIKGNLE